ncbi:MAG: 16S rRNA (adenine(1518)-N(6)/adenine(1519)-N(6))-dimethyltransferase RsmA [Pirellulales bacterium]
MSASSTFNQTQSFLARRFAEAGIRPQQRHGQNFLIDMNLVRLLLQTAEIGPNDVVLEVGTGTGSLTALMSQVAAAVVTVEIDPHLYQLASEELIDCPNVTMLHQDALRNKNALHPVVLAAVAEKMAESPGRRFKLVANLPYCVATPILANLLSSQPLPFSMTATIQKEVAERLIAPPSTKDYSALSIWMQSQCQVELVRIMPPSVFWPRPKVDSAIVRITIDESRRRQIPGLEFFHDFVRAMFFHRRKLLRSVLESGYKGRLSKQDADQIIAALSLSPTVRAEELDVATMLKLCEQVRARVGTSPQP